MSVYRIYVEKKPEFAVEANSLIGGIKSALGLENLTGLRVINRYDAEGLSREDFDLAAPVVFSEPAVDVTYDHLPAVKADEFVFAVEYLPGQFDQRADSCAQCISLLTGGKRPTIKSARIYIVSGKLTEAELDQIKHYMINPVESREASLDCFDTLDIKYTIPTTVKTVEGFIYSTDDDLRFMLTDLGLAMDFDDIKFCQDYFKNVEKRNPTITEIRMIDTYWSDHCRHTTFSTELKDVSSDDGYYRAPMEETYQDYLATHKNLYAGRSDKFVCLMDIALMAMKRLKKEGKLMDQEESDEIKVVSPCVFCTPGMTDEGNALVYISINRDEMPKMNHDGAEGSEVFEGFRLVSKEDAEEYLCKGRDEHGMYYPLFTWAALMFFMGV